jgi:3-oxoacyl-[acyl-carrier-protein] synthase-3
MEYSVVIKGTGAYKPRRAVSNAELAQRVETTDEWIRTRTGIGNRYIADADETPSFMGLQAARQALDNAKLTPQDIDCIIVATITPDMPFPSTAALIQAQLGARPVMAFDVEAACSGFLYALEVGRGLLQTGTYKHALVIGTEKISPFVDWQDRSSCIVFGDGAGAVVISREDGNDRGIRSCFLGADGNFTHILGMPGGGALCPASAESIAEKKHFIKMNGKEVFKVAVRYLEASAKEALVRANISLADVDWVIPHQANMRIIEALVDRLGVPMDKCYCNISEMANTSAASIPVALHQANAEGRLQKGQYILLVAFGAGLSWGGTVIRWE